MQHTDKYQLNLIETSDPFSPTPLNENTQAVEDLIRSIEAAYTPDNKPYVIGSYTGTGKDVAIDIGFRPSFVIISGSTGGGPGSQAGLTAYNIYTAGDLHPNSITFTETGFTVHHTGNTFPDLSRSPLYYEYIAFR